MSGGKSKKLRKEVATFVDHCRPWTGGSISVKHRKASDRLCNCTTFSEKVWYLPPEDWTVPQLDVGEVGTGEFFVKNRDTERL